MVGHKRDGSNILLMHDISGLIHRETALRLDGIDIFLHESAEIVAYVRGPALRELAVVGITSFRRAACGNDDGIQVEHVVVEHAAQIGLDPLEFGGVAAQLRVYAVAAYVERYIIA